MQDIKRTMILGNSITRHGPLADIGWHNDWGMAASCKDNDYVHLLMRRFDARFPGQETLFLNISDYERQFPTEHLDAAIGAIHLSQQWKPDLIVLRIGENSVDKDAPATHFQQEYEMLVKALRQDNTTVFCVNCFGKKEHINTMIEQAAKNTGSPFVDIAPLAENPENKAIGLYEHQGICDHPGDLGMARIAQTIWQAICAHYDIPFDEAII